LEIKVSFKEDMVRCHATRHKNPRIMKEGKSVSKGSAMGGQRWARILPRIVGDL
jgi:hypothetical protein